MRALLLTLLFVAGGCEAEPHRGEWRFAYASPDLAARAVALEARVLEGGCISDTVIYRDDIAPGDPGRVPPRLDPGRYGFAGRARDASCTWFAEGCVERELPLSGASEVIEVAIREATTPEAVCMLGTACDVPSCDPNDAGPADAGPGDIDAGHGGDGGHDAGSSDAGPDASCGPSGGCGYLRPSNVGGTVRIDDGTADLELIAPEPNIYRFDTDDGSITLVDGAGGVREVVRDPAMGDRGGIGFHVVTPPGSIAVPIGVFTFRSLVVRTGATLRPVGSRPIAILAHLAVTIDGRVLAGASTPGDLAAGASPGGVRGQRGRGYGGGDPGTAAAPDDSGGAGGSFAGRGGAGGGTTIAPGPESAFAYAPDALEPLIGGSGGGGGSETDGGSGGDGAGAIQLSAGQEISIRIDAIVDASGGGGRGGLSMGPAGAGSGGGGGSGGAILLEAPRVILQGWAGANGGGGGGGATCTTGCPGGDGENGWAIGAARGGGPGGGLGAEGGRGSAIDGTVGDGLSNQNAGGGGGGAGRVRINVRDAAGVFVNVSPSIASGLSSVGDIRLE